MPEISVIIPVYNAQSFLTKSINSVLKQTLADFELLLVNDGSTDMSILFCNSFAKKDCRIRVLDMPHRGVVAARNTGIKEAKGNYIAFIDNDDWIGPEYLMHLYTASKKYDADITLCKTVHEFGDGPKVWYPDIKGGVYSGEECEELKKTGLFWCESEGDVGFLSMPWDKLYKRSLLLENIRFFDENIVIGDELILSTACLLDSHTICLTEYEDYHYLRRESSAMHGSDKEINDINDAVHLIRLLLHRICSEKGYDLLAERSDFAVAALAFVRIKNKNCEILPGSEASDIIGKYNRFYSSERAENKI